MWIPPDILNNEGPRRWFLDSPETDVLSPRRERELLLELAECKGRIAEATRRPDGSNWGACPADAEFQALIRDLTGAGPAADPRTAALRPLARRYQEVRTALALANSRLVAHIAKRYADRGIAPSDLVQEGFCGLLTAIDRFDPRNATRLATYAVWWIRQAMQRAIAGSAYPVRLNPKQLRRLARAMPRSDAVLAGLPVAADPRGEPQSESLWRELAAIRPRVSLDTPCRDDGATPLAHLLAAASDPERDEGEAVEALARMIADLKPREQAVLKMRFGLDGEPRHSLSQVSKTLDVSKERVRQIQERALQKLRRIADGCGPCDEGRARPATAAISRPSQARSGLVRTAAGD
jgi:RNA polymerase primary sigma factor